MAKKIKGFCPGCGQSMKLSRRYCTNCGKPNAMLFPAPVRRRPALKSAGSCYASVVPMRPARDTRWAQILADPDPGRREELTRVHFGDYSAGGAA